MGLKEVRMEGIYGTSLPRVFLQSVEKLVVCGISSHAFIMRNAHDDRLIRFMIGHQEMTL